MLMKGIHPVDEVKILVMCPKEVKLAIDTVRRYVQEYKDNTGIRLLIVIQGITAAAKKEIQACKRFELFSEKELFRNKTQHQLYVPHRALNDEEEQAILDKYRCDKTKFPSILRKSDAIAKYFAWPAGKIIEVTHRPGGTYEPFKEYCVVVDE